MMKRVAVFPGSFDPITKGHENILLRSLPLFDKIIVAIGVNSSKQSFYTLDQREKWIKQVLKNEPKVEVKSYSGLTIDFCKKVNANYILRGLRTATDFEFENLIGQNNKVMAPEIETVFMIPISELSAINSTVVRDIVRNGGDVTPFIPSSIKIENK